MVAGLESRHKFIRNTVARFLQEDIDDDQGADDVPVNWNIHLSPEGAERIAFDRHIQRPEAKSSLTALSSETTSRPESRPPSDSQRPFRLQKLPAELQLRILNFCSDERATVIRLLHISSLFRAEASKIFFSDPYTYYSVDAAWLLTGGHAGHTAYSMSFLPLVQNIEVDYGVDADTLISRRGGDWWFPQVRDGASEMFWKVLKEKFKNVKRVVLYQTSARHSMYEGNMSPWLKRLVETCPLKLMRLSSRLWFRAVQCTDAVRFEQIWAHPHASTGRCIDCQTAGTWRRLH